MTDRYARQIVLPEVGAAGQAALGAAHVVIVGAGGLGCPAAQYLVGAGVGTVTLVDGDTVSESNLHRQILFSEADVGQPKVTAAARRLGAANGACRLMPLAAPLTPAVAPDLVASADVVLDCADSFAVSYILSDACRAADTPLISASALGTSGYVGGFCAGAPSLRAIFPDLPTSGATCATAGVLGPVVGILGAMQAQMALAVLLGTDPSPLGQLTRFDGLTLRSSGFSFLGAPEPSQPLRFLDPSAIAPGDFVADLRSLAESPAPVVPNAHRTTAEAFASGSAPTPAPDQRAVLTCRSGLRAWRAATALRSHWAGDIVLVAMGDAPNPQITETP
ncbi:molybdopterin/thiamine biosynthesis dinucleotide-utilizing protein [Jannaschia pagri]|uniref:Molybdopterin/thiamine biosynthesis dinucleotide-utilizing protein n=1 Tax=Jannaschia pagri TaxID=2829797 RepID=A0ABQ4NJQ2_9RHOB|nr:MULTISPECIES: HesA/MoeB/ThiF family protein [unclassified Jannaschia]GIT90796.1 molybdopterin/thiamine biosynthesis dinucleotide-utilizing protein [Jannaschia sp. AI_61]GIT94628.1 molybdopterin/thiamine biosynthesis dinucleotide-utilizing protein [Jannaschia sp. AI_62]